MTNEKWNLNWSVDVVKREWIESRGYVMGVSEVVRMNNFFFPSSYPPAHFERFFFFLVFFIVYSSFFTTFQDSNYCVCCVFIFLTVVQLFYTYVISIFSSLLSIIIPFDYTAVSSKKIFLFSSIFNLPTLLFVVLDGRWSFNWNRSRAKDSRETRRHEKWSILHS